MGGCKDCGKYECSGECIPTCQVCGINGGIYAGGLCGPCYSGAHGPVSATNKNDVEQLLWKMKNGEEFNTLYPSGMDMMHTNELSSLVLQTINTGQFLGVLHSLNAEYIWGVSLCQQSPPIVRIHYTMFSSDPYPICPPTFDDIMGKIEADLIPVPVPVPPSTPPSLVEHPPHRCSTSTCWCQLSMWYLHRPAPCPVPTRPKVV